MSRSEKSSVIKVYFLQRSHGWHEPFFKFITNFDHLLYKTDCGDGSILS